LAAVIAVGGWVTVRAGQSQVQPQPQLPGAPLGSQGEAIYPAVEGWGPIKDGTNTILVGYYNRNRDQTVDIPIGPNNRIEPGGPDMGQPTHFEPGRHYGVFSIQVPKDFGDKKYTWTLVVNGQTAQVQLSLRPPYWVDFFKNSANGNTPPVVKFAKDGPELVGPPLGYAQTLSATVNQPLTLTLWASDKPNTYDPEEGLPDDLRSANQARGRGGNARARRGGGGAAAPNFDVSGAVPAGQNRNRDRGTGPRPDVTVSWKMHRAPAPVTFKDEEIRLFNEGNIDAVMEATTTATFSKAGEYVLRAQVNDQSGDGGNGDQCCWTDALVKVDVK
jgi:hypothetical protein